MTLTERNQKVRDFFNGKIDTSDDVHSEYMQTKIGYILRGKLCTIGQ